MPSTTLPNSYKVAAGSGSVAMIWGISTVVPELSRPGVAGRRGYILEEAGSLGVGTQYRMW